MSQLFTFCVNNVYNVSLITYHSLNILLSPLLLPLVTYINDGDYSFSILKVLCPAYNSMGVYRF